MAMQVVQAVQAVHLESDAFLVCLNHALSTEKEEVMGLCIGEVSRSVSLAEPCSALPACPRVGAGCVQGCGGPRRSDPWTDGPVAGVPYPPVA